MKLKKGWQAIVVVSLIVAFVASYIITTLLYLFKMKFAIKYDEAIFQPVEVITTVINDPDIGKIVPILPIIALFVVIYYFRKNIFNYEKYDNASDFGLKGSARWGIVDNFTDGKILSKKAKFSKRNFKKGLKMEEGIVVGKVPQKNKTLVIHDKTNLDNKNVFISGSSGSGKGQSYVLSNLVNIRNEGIVVIDPKGENYEYTHQLKRDQGYKVYNIDFADFSEARYNPLDYVKNDEDAKKVSEIITKNSADDVKMDYFTERAQALLASLISYVKSEYPQSEANMEKVIDVFNEYVSDPDKCDAWIENMPNESPAKGQLLGVLGELNSPNTRSSVTSSFQSITSIFQLNRVKKITKTSDFLFDDFQKEKSILYVKISVPTNPFKSLTSVFFVQMIDRFFELGDRDPLGRLKVPIHFILDEFPNIGKIDGYQETLALCRGYRMSMHTIIQDVSQLEQKSMYGKETFRSIVSNHSVKLILKVGEPETAEYWSKWFGDTTVKYRSESISHGKQGKSKNTSYNYDKRKLLLPNELLQMSTNEAYLLITGHDPLKIEKAWQFLVYPNLLSDKNRNLVYNESRKKLGYTGDPYQNDNEGRNNRLVFEDYQKGKYFEENAEKIHQNIQKIDEEKASNTDNFIESEEDELPIEKDIDEELDEIEETVKAIKDIESYFEEESTDVDELMDSLESLETSNK